MVLIDIWWLQPSLSGGGEGGEGGGGAVEEPRRTDSELHHQERCAHNVNTEQCTLCIV